MAGSMKILVTGGAGFIGSAVVRRAILAGTPDVSWANFTGEIMAQAGYACKIKTIPSSHYPTLAQRLSNSRMDCKTLTVFGLSQPDWKVNITKTLHDLGTIQ
jgi:dTDP-4-dehydrorhamnose reductase